MPRTFVWHRTRGPKTTAPNELTTGKVRIKQVRSGIGHSWRMRATLEAIGFTGQVAVLHGGNPQGARLGQGHQRRRLWGRDA